jgi:uncharacterized membrane protein
VATQPKAHTEICQICRQEKTIGEVMPATAVRNGVVDTIRKKYPDWSTEGFICFPDIERFRSEYVQDALEAERGEISTLDAEVLESLKQQDLLAKDINAEFTQKLTFGQRLADKIAEFGGSWGFIITFGCILATWVTINSVALLMRPFDPFPYILLNLVLSCLASIQAPVIMMSQNRQEAKDRLRSEQDYKTNLKAELEIRHLHEKMDHLLKNEWQRLLEIQQIQTDLMEELISKGKGEKSN